MSATRDREFPAGFHVAPPNAGVGSWLDTGALRRRDRRVSEAGLSGSDLSGSGLSGPGAIDGVAPFGGPLDDDGALEEIKRALSGFPRDLAARGDMTMPLDLVAWRHFLSRKCGWDILSPAWSGDDQPDCDAGACSGVLPSRSLMFHVSGGSRGGVVPVFGFGGGHRPGDRSDRAVLDVLDAVVCVRGDEDAVLLHASPVVIVSKDAPNTMSRSASDNLLSVSAQPRILMFGGWLVSRGVVQPFCLGPGGFGATWDQWGSAADRRGADQWDSIQRGSAEQGAAEQHVVDLDAYRRSRRVDLPGAKTGARDGSPGGRNVLSGGWPSATQAVGPAGRLVERAESSVSDMVHDVAFDVKDPSQEFFRAHSWPDPGAMLSLVASLDGRCLVSRALRGGVGKASQAPRVTCRDVAMLRIGAGRWRLPVLKSTLIGDPCAKRVS